MTCLLEIRNLRVQAGGKTILNGIDLVLRKGEVHAIMGPNGSGKSTLASTILGHSDYEIVKGRILFGGKKINHLKTYERANLGIFLGFQSPLTIEGVKLLSLVKAAKEKRIAPKHDFNVFALRKELSESLQTLGLSDEFIMRSVHHNSSGGEKKKIELVQMQSLKPKLAILDEIDTGLDVDALKTVSQILCKKKDMATILITHSSKLVRYIEPDRVHIMMDGRIVKSGSKDLAQDIEKRGYSHFTRHRMSSSRKEI